jgi:O-antigen/teichoic acid export membrane protein
VIGRKLFSGNNKNLFEKGIFFTSFSFISNGLNFLLVLVLSNYLSKEDFGRINLYLIFIMVISNIISLGTESYFSVNYFNYQKVNLRKIISTIIYITASMSILLLLLTFLIEPDYVEKYALGTNILCASIIICFFQLFQNFLLEVLRLEEKLFEYGLITLSWVTLNLLLTFLFLFKTDMNYKSRIYAHFISSVIMFIVSIFFLSKKKYFSLTIPSKALLKEALSFGLPLLPHNSTVWLRSGMDRYFVSFFFNAALLGVYSFALNLSGLLLMIGTAFNAISSVYIYKTLSKKEQLNDSIDRQIYFMLKLYFLISILGFTASVIIIKLYFPKYNDSIVLLLPFFIAALFQCYYYLFVNFILYYKQTKKLMYITFSISVAHVTLSLLFTRHSVLYTAFLHMFSNIVICYLVYLLSLKYLPNFKGVFLKKLSI